MLVTIYIILFVPIFGGLIALSKYENGQLTVEDLGLMFIYSLAMPVVVCIAAIMIVLVCIGSLAKKVWNKVKDKKVI